MHGSQDTSRHLNGGVHHVTNLQASLNSDLNDNQSAALSRGTSYLRSALTSDDNVSSNSSSTFFHDYWGMFHGAGSMPSCDVESEEEFGEFDELVRSGCFAPTQQIDAHLPLSTSGLSTVFLADVDMPSGSSVEWYSVYDQKKASRSKGSCYSLIPSVPRRDFLSTPRMDISFLAPFVEPLYSEPIAPSEGLPSNSIEREGRKESASRLRMARPHRSLLFSQLSSTKEFGTYPGGEFSLCFKNHTSDDTQGSPLASTPLKKRLYPAARAELGEMLKRCWYSHQSNYNNDSIPGDTMGLWFYGMEEEAEEEECIVSRRSSGKDMNDSAPPVGANAHLSSPQAMSRVSREAHPGARRDEWVSAMVTRGSHSPRKFEGIHTTDRLTHSSSFFRPRKFSSGSRPLESLNAGERIFSKAAFRVLRGNFDNDDASLDSRILDASSNNEGGSNSGKLRCSSSRRSSSLSHGLTSGSVAGRLRGSIIMTGGRGNSLNPLADASARLEQPGHATANIMNRPSRGRSRDLPPAVGSPPFGRVQDLRSSISHSAMILRWRLLSFRDLDDTPLTNYEQVPHSDAAKRRKKKGKDTRKSKRNARHHRSRDAAQCDGRGEGATSGEHGDGAQKDSNLHGGATRVFQERGKEGSPVEVSQPQEGDKKSNGSTHKKGDVHESLPHNLGTQQQSSIRDATDVATGTGMRRPKSTISSRIPSTFPDNCSRRLSGITAGDRSAKSGENIQSFPVAGPGHLQTSSAVSRESQPPHSFQGEKGLPLMSPSATARHVTVHRNTRRISKTYDRKVSGTGLKDISCRQLCPGPPSGAQHSRPMPPYRLPRSLYSGTDSHHTEATPQMSSRQTDRLPQL